MSTNKKYIYGATSALEARKAEDVVRLFIRQDFEKALEKAKECQCMSWLVNIYGKLNGQNDLYELMTKYADAGVFYAHGLSMAFLHCSSIPREMTEIAAENGCPISQCLMYEKTKNTYWAELAANQGYSHGYYHLGKYREAAELGNVEAICRCARFEGPEGWYWECIRLLLNGNEDYSDAIKFNTLPHDCICQIGAMLPMCTIARTTYLAHCTELRKSIDSMSICLQRLGVYKDVRIFIAKIMWKNRVYRLSPTLENKPTGN